MYFNLLVINLAFILFINISVRAHESHNYQNVINPNQPHVHPAPHQPAVPPPQQAQGGQGGQVPPDQAPVAPEALWEKYGKHDFMHDLNHLREEANNLLYMQESDQITNDQSAFYYTKLHDFNSDGRLDGLELLLAVKHSLIHHNASYEFTPLEDMSNYVDSELSLMDLNNDGYVDYGEIYTYMQNNKQNNQDNQPKTQ